MTKQLDRETRIRYMEMSGITYKKLKTTQGKEIDFPMGSLDFNSYSLLLRQNGYETITTRMVFE